MEKKEYFRTPLDDLIDTLDAGDATKTQQIQAAKILSSFQTIYHHIEGKGPFISGTIGKQSSDGMFEGFWITPIYGADFRCTIPYMRREETANESEDRSVSEEKR